MTNKVSVTVDLKYHRGQFDDWLAGGRVEFKGKTYYWSAQDSNYGFGWEVDTVSEGDWSNIDKAEYDQIINFIEGCYMDTTKSFFIKQVNKHGVLYVRERNAKEDLTGWGALEFILNNGLIIVVSGCQFGQGSGEEGLWVDMHHYKATDFVVVKKEIEERKRLELEQEEGEGDVMQEWFVDQLEHGNLENLD